MPQASRPCAAAAASEPGPLQTSAAADAAVLRLLLSLARAMGRSAGEPMPPDLPDQPLVDAVARGFVAEVPNGLRLTGQGRIWLKNKLAAAGSEPARPGAKVPATPSAPAPARAPLINLAESPLAWLARRRDGAGGARLTPEQFQAGERLRADFTFAQLGPRVTADWSRAASSATDRRGVAGGGAALRDEVVAAQERVKLALKAVGADFAGVLLDVCCYLKGLTLLETERGWPRRSGKVILLLALSSLARHYGLTGGARRSGSAIAHWGASDYRPSIDGGDPEA